MRQLLKNANIYDGTGAPAFRGDVLIEDDRIAKVGPDLTDPADLGRRKGAEPWTGNCLDRP